MHKFSGLAAAVAFAVAMAGSTVFAGQGSADKGKAVFDGQKCAMCHAVAGKGNPKGPLDGVGSKLKADELRAWVTDPATMIEKTKATRKPAMPSYKAKVTGADLDNLVAYLESLKK